MRKRLNRKLLVGLIALVGLISNALGQQRFRKIEEPRWLKLRVTEVDAGVYAEGRFEETSFGNSGTSVTYNSIFFGPSFGLSTEGSIYHPYLCRFSLNSEGAYGWAQDTITSAAGTSERTRMEYLGRIVGSADILANKPYNANLFGTYDHSFRDYDFFSRVTVDTVQYGGKVAYEHGPFIVGLNYTHHEEDSSGLVGSSTSEEDVTTLQARHQRDHGVTTASYTYNQFTREDIGRIGTGENHSISIADAERFGSREQFTLNTSASYYLRNSSDEPNDEITANANLGIDHRPNLSSYYDVNYYRYVSDRFTSDSYSGQAQLRHRLYDSLTSTLIALASDSEFSDVASSGYSRRFGAGFSEAYTKTLGPDHRLVINNSAIVEHVDQQSVTTIENERHSFAESVGGSPLGSFFLNQPRVLQMTIVVTDSADTPPPFVFGIDYDIRTLGSRTIIERLAGSRIPEDAVVLVDYHTEPTQAGSYEGLDEIFQIRFDLFQNFWGVYGRFNLYANNAPTNMHVPTVTSYALGTDISWRWLRAGAEYEIYMSDESDYNSMRLFQSFSFRPDDASTLGLEVSESWTDYTDADRQESNYRFITLYRRGLTRRLKFEFDGGINLRRGDTFDRTLMTVRPGFQYTIGRTSIRAGYDYEHEVFLNTEERSKHLFFIRAKRVF